VEYFSEEVLKVLVSFERRDVQVGMLCFSLKAKPFPALQIELLLEGCLVLTLELKGVLVH
jgi:hypothetical protein